CSSGVLALVSHRAELKHGKGLTIEPKSNLGVEHRTRRGELDQHCEDENQWDGQYRHAQCNDPLHGSLARYIPSVTRPKWMLIAKLAITRRKIHQAHCGGFVAHRTTPFPIKC